MPPSFSNSKILTNEKSLELISLLAFDETLYPGQTWQLLFQASLDGFKAKNFHSKCDGLLDTLVVVRVGNSIFGGYTEADWY